MKKKSNKYWTKRAEDNVKNYNVDVDYTMKVLNNAYNSSLDDINKQIKNIYDNFKIGSGLSSTEIRDLLNTKISPKEMNSLRRQIYSVKDEELKKYLLAKYNSQAYRARITRLEAIKQNLYVETKKLYPIELIKNTKLFTDLINKAYYRNIFDIQKGLGIGFDFADIPMDRVNYILNNNWSGEHYSKRIWNNTDILANNVQETVLRNVMAGTSLSKLSSELSERMNVGKFAAERLLRTETSYITNMAEMESYTECDIDKYKYVATLDKRTSKPCQQLDGKIFEVSKAVTGKNMPPRHVFCRSTTVAYFDYLDYSNLQRRARDKDGKPILVPQEMDYENWKKIHLK